MKKDKLSLKELKISSFIINLPLSLKTIKGGDDGGDGNASGTSKQNKHCGDTGATYSLVCDG